MSEPKLLEVSAPFTAVLVTALLYAAALAQMGRRGRSIAPTNRIAFALGLLVLAGALAGPVDALADDSLAWHMLQHLLLIGGAAPLLLLGAPHRAALGALSPQSATRAARFLSSRALHVMTSLPFAWLTLTVVLYATHFSTLYEAALEHPPVHAVEHALYLLAALLFWTPLLAVAPAPDAPPHAARILTIFLALPMSAFLGFAFYVARGVMYPHYASHPAALADQANAGAVMWLAGGIPLFLALLWCIADWGKRERRLDAISDSR